MTPFPCYRCGKCCANVHLSALTSSLDRGDGVCRHLNTITRLCTIYETRPEICQIELQYSRNYAHLWSWEGFIKLNLEACERLPDGNLS